MGIYDDFNRNFQNAGEIVQASTEVALPASVLTSRQLKHADALVEKLWNVAQSDGSVPEYMARQPAMYQEVFQSTPGAAYIAQALATRARNRSEADEFESIGYTTSVKQTNVYGKDVTDTDALFSIMQEQENDLQEGSFKQDDLNAVLTEKEVSRWPENTRSQRQAKQDALDFIRANKNYQKYTKPKEESYVDLRARPSLPVIDYDVSDLSEIPRLPIFGPPLPAPPPVPGLIGLAGMWQGSRFTGGEFVLNNPINAGNAGAKGGGFIQPRAPAGATDANGDKIGGRFLSGLSFRPADLEGIGRALRKMLTDNYKTLGIKVQTGTLMKALEEADIKVSSNQGSFSIQVTPKDLTRVRDPIEIEGKSAANDFRGHTFQSAPAKVSTYAPIVFFGRGPVSSVNGLMVFPQFGYQGGSPKGQIYKTKSARGTHGKNVFDLNAEQIQQLLSRVKNIMTGDTLEA